MNTNMNMRLKSAEICLILAFILSFIRHVSTLSINVNEVECVYEEIMHEGDKVTSPAGHDVYSLKGTSGDKFEFKAIYSGMYQFCFHNPISTPEVVSFHIHVGHIPNEQDLAKDEHLDPIYIKIAELREALESVTADQKYLKARDARHRHTNLSTRKRVIFYTISEYFLLAGASTLQVMYIRRLFSNSGYARV
ncbi:transmembrane emp24 domain-containing protein p24beta3-like isoform X2 [Mangifera indica]|uniref:transmembrane emp24 domain-containing protein p24beta3-like isoform X2 n=1 Tax=Mangifera indica TaxID=29780 RepID=UPI001CFAA6CC|nr:transmembrane emp24 domain-containing protein p24beta3-like isoform X2 [Mangifera indica]